MEGRQQACVGATCFHTSQMDGPTHIGCGRHQELLPPSPLLCPSPHFDGPSLTSACCPTQMANLGLPSAVQLLEEQIERRKATGQRFSSGPVNIEDTFRSARRAPNEQVRPSSAVPPSSQQTGRGGRRALGCVRLELYRSEDEMLVLCACVSREAPPHHDAAMRMAVRFAFSPSRCASPRRQVRNSVRNHPSNNRRIDPPIEVSRDRSLSPPKFGPGSPTKGLNGSLDKSICASHFAGGEQATPAPHDLHHGGRFTPCFAGTTAPGAEPRPQNQFRVNVCQRVEPPKDLNAPARVDEEDPDAKKLQLNRSVGVGGNKGSKKDLLGAVNKRQASNTKMKDQELLAFACRR